MLHFNVIIVRNERDPCRLTVRLMEQVESKTYRKAVRRIEAIESMIAGHVMAKSPTLTQQLKTLSKKVKLNATIRAARGEVRTASTLVFKDELKARKRVLRRLGYVRRKNR